MWSLIYSLVCFRRPGVKGEKGSQASRFNWFGFWFYCKTEMRLQSHLSWPLFEHRVNTVKTVWLVTGQVVELTGSESYRFRLMMHFLALTWPNEFCFFFLSKGTYWLTGNTGLFLKNWKHFVLSLLICDFFFVWKGLKGLKGLSPDFFEELRAEIGDKGPKGDSLNEKHSLWKPLWMFWDWTNFILFYFLNETGFQGDLGEEGEPGKANRISKTFGIQTRDWKVKKTENQI